MHLRCIRYDSTETRSHARCALLGKKKYEEIDIKWKEKTWIVWMEAGMILIYWVETSDCEPQSVTYIIGGPTKLNVDFKPPYLTFQCCETTISVQSY